MSPESPCANATLFASQGSGNSFKPALALAQLGIPHRIQFVNALGGETRTPSFLAMNKAGQVPFLVDATGFGMGESNAMLPFIAEGSCLLPEQAADRAVMLQWMFFEQTRLEPYLAPARLYKTVLPHREREFVHEMPVWREKASQALDLLDDFLFTSRFVAKRHGYSVGDIALFGYVHLSAEAGLDLGRFRNVCRWISRVEATAQFRPMDVLLRPDPALARRLAS